MVAPTGIFYHKSFSKRSYLTLGSRLKDFPKAFDDIRSRNYRIIESPVVDENLILRVHTPNLLENVKRDCLCSTAWRSAGGVVKAAEMVYRGDLSNAFCYIGSGGHHAGRNYFWGYCCFNDVVLSIYNLFEKFGKMRIAIIDTDAHHGDGTRELVFNSSEILHYCICDRDFVSTDGLKIDVPYFGNDYIELVKKFCKIVESFSPKLIFWYFGHDTHKGDYGDVGLEIQDYVRTAEILKNLASKISNGKLVVVLGGGSDSDIARKSTISIINVLASL